MRPEVIETTDRIVAAYDASPEGAGAGPTRSYGDIATDWERLRARLMALVVLLDAAVRDPLARGVGKILLRAGELILEDLPALDVIAELKHVGAALEHQRLHGGR